MTRKDEAAFNEAIQRARDSFKFCWREVSWEQRRIVPALGGAWVKLAFSDPSIENPDRATEFMWVTLERFDGAHLVGELINQPHTLTNIDQGARVNRPTNTLIDWLYFFQGRAYGGFTVQHFRARMAPEKRQAHDENWGAEFGDPSEVLVEAHKADPPQAEPPGFLRRILGAPKRSEHRDHPMCLNCVEKFGDQMKSNPDLVTQPDNEGFTMLHRDALAGNLAMVHLLVSLGADRNARTPSGETAADLATKMTWDEIAAYLKAH